MTRLAWGSILAPAKTLGCIFVICYFSVSVLLLYPQRGPLVRKQRRAVDVYINVETKPNTRYT